jgi:hypothetical protein
MSRRHVPIAITIESSLFPPLKALVSRLLFPAWPHFCPRMRICHGHRIGRPDKRVHGASHRSMVCISVLAVHGHFHKGRLCYFDRLGRDPSLALAASPSPHQTSGQWSIAQMSEGSLRPTVLPLRHPESV